MNEIFDAALQAGALGVYLSGSGPTVLAFCTVNAEAIGDKMKAVAQGKGLNGKVKMVEPCSTGAHIISGLNNEEN
jgi:homoserine kinase